MVNAFSALRRFAHEHDDQPAFHAAYLVLVLLAAMLFNLGVFGLLILAHMSLDFVKYRERHGLSWILTFDAMIRESLIDITLLIVGVAVSVYVHHSPAVAGVSAMLRVPEGLLDPLILAFPKIEILQHFVGIIAHAKRYMRELLPWMMLEWTGTDRLCFFLCAVSVVCTFAAAPVLHIPLASVLHTLGNELIPWRM